MFTELRRNHQLSKVKPGSGRPLKPYRWWQTLSGRSLFHLDLPDTDGTTNAYAVDVWQMGRSSDGEVWAQLFLDGRHHAEAKVPATFAVPGGVIEVATSNAGLKRCHYVAEDGMERQLEPDASSAEGRRAKLARERPSLSRAIGAMSIVMLAIGLGLNIIQALEPISRIPFIAETMGVFTSPITLPWQVNVALAVLAGLAAVERGLRLRYSWLDATGT